MTDGDTIAVGSHGDDDLGTNSGSVYVYRHDAASGQWVEQPKLTAPDGVAGDEFGWGVGVDAGTIVAGSHGRGVLVQRNSMVGRTTRTGSNRAMRSAKRTRQ